MGQEIAWVGVKNINRRMMQIKQHEPHCPVTSLLHQHCASLTVPTSFKQKVVPLFHMEMNGKQNLV